MTDDNAGLEKAARAGMEIVGATVGALVAGGADPLLTAFGAVAGTSIAAVGRDVLARIISPRQTVRVGAVFMQAGAEINAQLALGKTIRDDGFWDGEHSHGSEFAEGVMLAAMATFEERKVPYLANILASVSFADNIDAATANWAIRTGEQLSWLEMCLLGIVTRSDEFPLPDEPMRNAEDWNGWQVKQAFSAMSMPRDLIQYKRAVTAEHRIATWDLRLSAVTLGREGLLISQLMDLRSIPQPDLAPVFKLLTTGKEDTSETAELADEESVEVTATRGADDASGPSAGDS